VHTRKRSALFLLCYFKEWITFEKKNGNDKPDLTTIHDEIKVGRQ
jgi:hypothetical protein